ncbi:DUF6722 family protein [Capnocytophaga leadbetteri]|jgi:hypothetical protein|uniref:DUF6722 family protein n=1 Tax=Capnocytophaga leadbetteri TaxID=327575 RepID=UPI0028F0E75C|nr:DUF6722 family protein [Capnocytophaga leadbetteri]
MKKRISDYLFDVSKYVLAGLFIAPLFNANVCDGGAFWSAAVFAVIALLVSLYFSKQKKGGMNKYNNNRPNNKNNHRPNKNNNNKNNAPQAKA